MRARRFLWAVVIVLAAVAAMATLGPFPAAAQTAARGTLSRYVAADFWGAIVIHPGRVAKSPLWAALPKSPAGAVPAMASIGPAEAAALTAALQQLDPTAVRRVVVLMEGMPQAGSGGAFVVQFEDDASQKWFGLLAAQGEAGEFQSFKYAKVKMPNGPELCVCAADPKILLAAPESSLQKMLSMPTGPQPLLEELRRASLDNDVIVALVSEGLVKAAGEQLPPPVQGILLGLKSAAATVNFSGDTLLHLDLMAAEEGAAAALQMQLNMLHTLGTQQIQAMKAQPSPMMPPELAGMLFPVLEEMLTGTKINKDGVRVTGDTKMPAKLPDLLKAAQAMTTFSTEPAGIPGMADAPEAKPDTPDAPEAKPDTPEAKPDAPEAKPDAPEAKPDTPEAKP